MSHKFPIIPHEIFSHENITTVPLELAMLDSLGELADVTATFIHGEDYHLHYPPSRRYRNSYWRLEHKHIHVDTPYNTLNYQSLKNIYQSFIRIKNEEGNL